MTDRWPASERVWWYNRLFMCNNAWAPFSPRYVVESYQLHQSVRVEKERNPSQHNVHTMYHMVWWNLAQAWLPVDSGFCMIYISISVMILHQVSIHGFLFFNFLIFFISRIWWNFSNIYIKISWSCTRRKKIKNKNKIPSFSGHKNDKLCAKKNTEFYH
jgi:hypothetical protein